MLPLFISKGGVKWTAKTTYIAAYRLNYFRGGGQFIAKYPTNVVTFAKIVCIHSTVRVHSNKQYAS